MPVRTADLVDSHPGHLRSCEVQFRQYGQVTAFHGPVRTLRTFEDNALLRKALSTPGEGAVLVVDGGGSLRCALIGDAMAGLAAQSGWAGLLIWGAVRDTVALGGIALGIKALGSNPWKSAKTGCGQLDVPVTFGGVVFRPGDWLYSDEDGIVVSGVRL